MIPGTEERQNAGFGDNSALSQLMASASPLDRFGETPGTEYTVKSGDTLSSIAQRHGIDVGNLARINGIDNPDLIMVGQKLSLPAGNSIIYTVVPGDTLSRIAGAHDTTVQQLLQANPQITNPNNIYPGQEIRIGASPETPAPPPPPNPTPDGAHRLGSLSETYESGGRGPGTVSGGVNDAGGVSYGVYQLSSTAGSAGSFMRNEGARWAGEFGSDSPGSAAFSDQWRTIAAREPEAFRNAQHAFIERTHYQPAVDAVSARTGLDLNGRHNAVRDATWSVAVQHGGAATILNRAVAGTDAQLSRDDPGYDRALVNNIYAERTSYVLDVANNSTRLTAGERQVLVNITETRYPAELRDALQMIDSQPAQPVTTPAPETPASGPIDGNAIAAQNGVEVKNANVNIAQLDASMGPVIEAVATAARNLGLPTPVITSGNDSRHSNGSLHFENQALDFRGNNISIAEGRRFEQEVSNVLGADYDVIFETFSNASNNHLHVEFDPS